MSGKQSLPEQETVGSPFQTASSQRKEPTMKRLLILGNIIINSRPILLAFLILVIGGSFICAFVSKTQAAVSLVTQSEALSTTDSSGATTTPVNTTGATLLVLGVHIASTTATSTVAIADSMNNTWNLIGWYPTNVVGDNHSGDVALYYAYNPTVGANQTVSIKPINSGSPSLILEAFSGTATSSAVYDAGSVNGVINENATSTLTGTSTPSTAGDVFVTMWGSIRIAESSTSTITNGFTVNTVNYNGLEGTSQAAYLISGNANPLAGR